MCGCPVFSQERGNPKVGVEGGSEPPGMAPLEEQQLPETTEPSLQHPEA